MTARGSGGDSSSRANVVFDSSVSKTVLLTDSSSPSPPRLLLGLEFPSLPSSAAGRHPGSPAPDSQGQSRHLIPTAPKAPGSTQYAFVGRTVCEDPEPTGPA